MDSASNMWFSNKYLQKYQYQYQYQNIELRITPSILKRMQFSLPNESKNFSLTKIYIKIQMFMITNIYH
jgi:hypothetical protein